MQETRRVQLPWSAPASSSTASSLWFARSPFLSLLGPTLVVGLFVARAAFGACGDTVVQPLEDEECDDGGVCVGGSLAGSFCSSDELCDCVPFGGDGCAANCTVETTIPFSILPSGGTGTAYSGYSGPGVEDYQLRADGAVTVGHARDGKIPIVIKDTFEFDQIHVGSLACSCLRPVARKTCGGLASAADCTEGYTAGASVCTGTSPCAFVHGEGNVAAGVITCTGLSEDDVTVTHDSSLSSPPSIVFSGTGADGASAIWFSAAQYTATSCVGMPELGYGEDHQLCTDDDLPGYRGAPATWPLVTGHSSGTILNFNGEPSSLGPIDILGNPFDCSLVAAGTLAGAALSSITTALEQPLSGDTLTATRLAFSPPCGDGLVQDGETCDDGNSVAGDGCSFSCEVEECYSCSGQPSVCAPADGAACDDGNACTLDSCAAGHCVGVNDDGAWCTDNFPCTRDDSCLDGVCSGTPDIGASCNDTNVCTTSDVCTAIGNWVGCRGTPNDHVACDDGNSCTKDDTCLATLCNGVPDDGIPCDDRNFCTRSDTCSGGSCSGRPRICNQNGQSPCTHRCEYPFGCIPEYGPNDDCRVPGKSNLQLTKAASPDKNKFLWKWSTAFLEIGLAELDDPVATTRYELCAYANPNPFGSFDENSLVLDMPIAGGGTCSGNDCWSPVPDKGYSYKDKEGTAAGITGVKLTTAPLDFSAKVQWKGKGAGLQIPALPLDTSSGVVVQMYNHDTGLCVESNFFHFRANDGVKGKFQASIP